MRGFNKQMEGLQLSGCQGRGRNKKGRKAQCMSEEGRGLRGMGAKNGMGRRRRRNQQD